MCSCGVFFSGKKRWHNFGPLIASFCGWLGALQQRLSVLAERHVIAVPFSHFSSGEPRKTDAPGWLMTRSSFHKSSRISRIIVLRSIGNILRFQNNYLHIISHAYITSNLVSSLALYLWNTIYINSSPLSALYFIPLRCRRIRVYLSLLILRDLSLPSDNSS